MQNIRLCTCRLCSVFIIWIDTTYKWTNFKHETYFQSSTSPLWFLSTEAKSPERLSQQKPLNRYSLLNLWVILHVFLYVYSFFLCSDGILDWLEYTCHKSIYSVSECARAHAHTHTHARTHALLVSSVVYTCLSLPGDEMSSIYKVDQTLNSFEHHNVTLWIWIHIWWLKLKLVSIAVIYKHRTTPPPATDWLIDWSID